MFTEVEVSEAGQIRKRRWPWVLLGVLAVLIGGWQLYRGALRAKVNRELQAIRQIGFPVRCQDLASWRPPISDQENAALGLMEASDNVFLPADAFKNINWARGEELGPEDRDELRSLLTNNAPALEMVHTAVQLKRCRFPIDYNRGPEALLPHLAKTKSLCQLLKADAVLASEEGRPEQAIRAVLDGLGLARCLDEEPLFISQLVRVACLAINCSTLERVLSQQTLTEVQLGNLDDAIQAAKDASRPAFKDGFAGEICLATFCFDASPSQLVKYMSLTDGGMAANDFSAAQILIPLYTWTGLRDRDFAFYLRTMRRMLEAADQPLPEGLRRSRQAARDLETDLQRTRLLIISRMLLPSLQKAMEKVADAEARLQGARTALAVERFRLQHKGNRPESLSQLVPDYLAKTPVDPFDGDPLRYRKLAVGYVVYSVGPDGQDDDGLERGTTGAASRERAGKNGTGASLTGRRANSSSYDVTFTVER